MQLVPGLARLDASCVGTSLAALAVVFFNFLRVVGLALFEFFFCCCFCLVAGVLCWLMWIIEPHSLSARVTRARQDVVQLGELDLGQPLRL